MTGALARNTVLLLGWQLLRAALQAVWAIGLARALGVDAYGLFAGFGGLAAMLGTLSGLGFGLLMLQAVSREPTAFSFQWMRSALMLALGSSLLLPVYVGLAPTLTGQPAATAMLVAIALPELALAPLTILCSYAFQARERMGWAGAMYATAPIGNICALALFVLFTNESSLSAYLGWHLWTAAGASMLAVASVIALLRPRRVRVHGLTSGAIEASGFVTMRMLDSGLGTIDKTLVLRLAGTEIAGQYTAAYRLAALIALPLVSLAISAAPRLFRRAVGSAPELRKLVTKLLTAGLLLATASVPVAWLLAGLLPWLFGVEFAGATSFARQLSPLAGLLGLCSLAAGILMALGRKLTRISIQACAIGLLVAAMGWLVPKYGGDGAVVAMIATHAALAVAMMLAVHRQLVRQT